MLKGETHHSFRLVQILFRKATEGKSWENTNFQTFSRPRDNLPEEFYYSRAW
jgi:hypothetical protein